MLSLVLVLCLSVSAGLARQPYEPRDINGDIDDFIDLVPMKQIEQLVNAYYQTDEEVKTDVDYVHSDEFKNKVFELETIPEVMAVRADLQAANVDVIKYINFGHDIMGWEHVNGLQSVSSGKGLAGLLDDVKPIMPMTRIKLMAAKKFIFSSQFRRLVSLLLSGEFQKKTQAVQSHPKVVALQKEAEAVGVDIDAITKFIESLTKLFPSYLELEMMEMMEKGL